MRGAEIDVEIIMNERGVSLELKSPRKPHTILASIFLEYYDGMVKTYVWNEEDEGDNPTFSVIMLKDPVESVKRLAG